MGLRKRVDFLLFCQEVNEPIVKVWLSDFFFTILADKIQKIHKNDDTISKLLSAGKSM
jgi:hypothetical protein